MLTPSSDAIIQAFPHATILTVGEDGVSVFNQSAAKLFPFLRPGSPLSFAIRNPELLTAVAMTARDRIPRKLEVMERLPVERAFAVHVTPADAGGTLVVFDDLTSGRNLERMRVDFIANASHELRTPLASLLGFVETLKGPARNDAGARDKFLGIMEVQAKRMARLIDDLLSLSRIELNAHVQPASDVDIIGVVGQIADALKPLATERDVKLQVTSHAGEALVAGERDELLRVFENLIENAIKYGASGKLIEIETAAVASDEVMVMVRDHGAGIAAEHLPRLTERFYRVSVSASRDAGGTGLGLAIVKHIVARHRGRLEITSKPGEGSSFRVFLKMRNDIS